MPRPLGVSTPPLERLFARVKYDHGCWTWTGSGRRGYSSIADWQSRRVVYGHRLVYEALIGPIPTGMQLDHVCRNPACVNPMHLEPVTPAENTRRGASCRESHVSCPRGHLFTTENTGSRWYGGREWRYCRACKREQSSAARAAGRWKTRSGHRRAA